MDNCLTTPQEDKNIDRKQLELDLEKRKKEYLEQKKDFEDFEESQQQAYDEAAEEEPTDPFQDTYDYYSTSAQIAEEKYNLLKSKASKYDQTEKFYNTYHKEGSNKYQKIIHKQSKSVSDKLNRKEDAKQIAELIKTDKVKTVGIFGEWGTGKSTFLEHIKKELISDKKIKIVDLKATEYSDREKIWTYFFTEMEKKAFEKNFFRGWWYNICHFFNRISFKLVYPVAYIVFYAIVIWLFYRLNLIYISTTLMKIKEEIVQQFTDVMIGIILVLFLFNFLNPILFQLIDLFNRRDTFLNPSKKIYIEKLGYKSVVKTNIDKLLKHCKNYHFVFIVDELDRCNKDSVMSFLESIQLIDDCENINIIYAIDEEIVLNAITESGFKKPQNYLKKYVDKRIYLESINKMDDCLATIAMDYELFEDEIEMIQGAMKNLDVNISVREYYHILNTISELREKWIGTEVYEKKAFKEKSNTNALDWYKFIPIAIFYLEGSIWPRKIFDDFKDTKEQYHNVNVHIIDEQLTQEYSKCPLVFKKMYMNDIINSISFLKNNNPLLYVNSKE